MCQVEIMNFSLNVENILRMSTANEWNIFNTRRETYYHQAAM